MGKGSVIEPGMTINHKDVGPFTAAALSWGTAYLNAVASAFGGGAAKAASTRAMKNMICDRTFKQHTCKRKSNNKQ